MIFGDSMTYWHYTCHHRAALIDADLTLRPHPQILMGNHLLVWLTDLDTPDREALGLTSTHLRCDRTEVRYRVVDGDIVPWAEWADVNRIDRRLRSELTFGRRPRHWFVSTSPVLVTAS